MLNTVGEALAKAGHRCAVLDGTALQRSTILEKFQTNAKDSPRVMLLKVREILSSIPLTRSDQRQLGRRLEPHRTSCACPTTR